MPELRFLLKIGISFSIEYFVYQNFHLKYVLSFMKNYYRKAGNLRFRKILLDLHKNFHEIHRLLNNSNKIS